MQMFRGHLGSEHEDCYETFEKLVRNSEHSKSDNFKKLSALAKILRFKLKICVNDNEY